MAAAVANGLDMDTTVHWHGLRIPHAMDGVPVLTQPPIPPGGRFDYTFTVPDAGTFWYHPHVRGSEQQGRGLYGALIVDEAEPPRVDRDVTWVIDDWRLNEANAISETFGNSMDLSHAGRLGNLSTLNGADSKVFAGRAGERLRLRLINTANARYQERLEALRKSLNASVGQSWEEWEVPREAGDGWSDAARKAHADWWDLRIARQEEIDKSIVQKADIELLYDRPYEDASKVRVTGPFSVESLSPHRVVASDEDELIDSINAAEGKRERVKVLLNDFTQMVIDNLKSAGVHQAAKDDRITFTTIEGWPGGYIAAEGHFMDGETERRAAIFIGPEFGTVTRADLTAAAREALDARFDALIACGFNFDAHTSELTKLGPLPILKAKMNPDLHMSEELKNTGAGNLFVVFGEPDIEWKFNDDGEIVVEVLGVDVFDPKTGEVRASGKDDIAAWFIDTDYNEESFFVRHAYFLGANDPYKSLKAA